MVRNILVFTWFFVRQATPIVVQLMWEAFSWLAISLASFWQGVPQSANQLAKYWLEMALRQGWPTLHDRELRMVLLAFAYVAIVGGWVALSFITVFIVRTIF
jgi:hypothetical protein